PRVAGHAGHGRNRLDDVQRLDERRLAWPEHERLRVRRERVVEAARAAVRDLLRLEREAIDLVVREPELEVLVERADDRDGHRGGAAEPHAARHLREYLDAHAAPREPELVEHDARGPLERAPIRRVSRELILDAPARNHQVNALVAVLDERLDRERNRRRDRMPAVHDRMLAEQHHLAVTDAHRRRLVTLQAAAVARTLPLALELRDDLLRLPDLDDPALDHAVEHLVEDLLPRPGRRH